MKKMMIFLAALLLVSSCETVESNSSDSAARFEEQTGLDMQEEYGRSGGFMCRAGSVYYTTMLRWLHYYDETDGSAGKLCAKADCAHENGQCNAYISGIGGVQYYDGMLYYIESMGAVGRMDLSGNHRESVMIIHALNGYDAKWTIHRDYLYTSILKSEVADGKPIDLYSIYRYKLGETGKGELIFENRYPAGTINETWRLYSNHLYLFMDENNRTKRSLYRINSDGGAVETLLSGASAGYVSDFRIDGEGMDILEKAPEHIRLIRYSFADGKQKEIVKRTGTKGYVAMLSQDRQRMIFYTVMSERGEDWIDYRIISREGQDLFTDKLPGDTWYLNGYGSDESGFLFQRIIIEEDVQAEELWRIRGDTGKAERLVSYRRQ